jgi:hypothetical protein
VPTFPPKELAVVAVSETAPSEITLVPAVVVMFAAESGECSQGRGRSDRAIECDRSGACGDR